MKLLFFDMEFANGQVPGSIYSFGYLVTNEEFEVLDEGSDILINPECEWNEYVEQKILAYPKEEVEAAPAFPSHYDFLRELFESVDVAVGFSVSNDNRALKKDCERYGLDAISYKHFDLEKLCRKQEEHKDAHGLAGYYTAWCGEAPDHQHRSDGDALATMELLRAVCSAKHVTAEMMMIAYPECGGDSQTPSKATKKSSDRKNGGKKRHRRPGRHSKKKTEQPAHGAELPKKEGV
ncbi:MAG: 3'-5' exonuclease [Clostridia bacterium]|nr:3'-5' exonuclease [Clostridia bacterium]